MTALKNAIITQKTDSKVIFHSDRGVQYASQNFRNLLLEKEFVPSMSRKGNCYDNCFAETFFGTMKTDLKVMGIVLTQENIISEIFKYIEVWYNRKRLHSSLDYMSPIEFRNKFVDSHAIEPPSNSILSSLRVT